MAHASDAPMPLCCHDRGLVVGDHGKVDMGVDLSNMTFNKIGKGGNWERARSSLPDFFAYTEQKRSVYSLWQEFSSAAPNANIMTEKELHGPMSTSGREI